MQPRGHKVHDLTKDSHKCRFVKADRNRVAQPHKAFPTDQGRDDGQDGSASKGSKVAHF